MGFDELQKQLNGMLDADQIADEMLKSAAPILVDALKNNISKAANRGYATGKLKNSITANKPGKNAKGHYISVTPKGKDEKSVRNGEKLGYLNYGVHGKQTAHPVIGPAVHTAREKCMEAMQKKFEEVTKI